MSVRLWLVAVVVALLGGVGLGYWLHGAPPIPPSVAHAAAGVARTDTLYRRDTLHATKWATRYDTARVTETVTHDSIVYVPRDVADSAVHACRDALSSCAVTLRARDVLIAALRAERPSRLGGALTGLYDPRHQTGVARGELAVRLSSRWSVLGEAERGLAPRDSLQLRAGARWTF